MHSVLNKRIPFLTLILSLAMVNAAAAHRLGAPPVGSPFFVPPVVRLTGTLVPAKEQQERGLDTLAVWLNGQEWVFKLTDVKTLSGTNYGAMILNKLFPREVRFKGSDEVLHSIQNTAATGKPLTVEGRLYIADRNFLVLAQEESSTKPSQTLLILGPVMCPTMSKS